jgi:hypothetical protein
VEWEAIAKMMLSAVLLEESKRTCTEEALGSSEQRAVQATANGRFILKGDDCAEPEVSNWKNVPATLVAVTLGSLTTGATGTVTIGALVEDP